MFENSRANQPITAFDKGLKNLEKSYKSFYRLKLFKISVSDVVAWKIIAKLLIYGGLACNHCYRQDAAGAGAAV